jgi:hypothetical protein
MTKTNLFIKINIFLTLLFVNICQLDAAPICPQAKNSLHTKHSSVSEVITMLKNFPESNQVINKALKEGSITVEILNKGMPFEAMWASTIRKIAIDGRSHSDQGKILCHLLFELTNAVSESKYQDLYLMAKNGLIDCDSYVETVEKIEHQNMVQTVDIIEKGIATGVFPSSARWTIVYDFAIHYKIQQLVGHSLLIAEEYQDIAQQNSLSNYRGTVKNLKKMSKNERTSLAGYLYSDYLRPKRDNRTFVIEA